MPIYLSISIYLYRQLYLRVLSAEGAVVLGVLGDLHLLDDLSQGGAISGAVLAANASLLGVSLDR